MAKCSTDTCCLTLPLRLEKWQEDRLAKRFEIARQIYNTMVRAELKKLRAMEQSEPYKANQEKIQALDWKTQADKQALKALYKERDKLLRDGGFSEYGFKSDIKNYYKKMIAKVRTESEEVYHDYRRENFVRRCFFEGDPGQVLLRARGLSRQKAPVF